MNAGALVAFLGLSSPPVPLQEGAGEAEDPLSVSVVLVADGSAVLAGGVRRRGAVRGLLDVGARLDLEPTVGVAGTLNVLLQGQAGRDGSRDVGDLQAYSNIDGPDLAQVSELWYERELSRHDGEGRLLLGKFDANNEFAYTEHGALFLQSSMGYSPTILPFPSYPNPAFGGALFWESGPGWYGGVGVFDGAQQAGVQTGSLGPGTLFGEPSDLFLIAEGGARWGEELAGRLAVGAWHHTGEFDGFDGSVVDGTSGAYAVFDQQLERLANGIGRGLFLQVGLARETVSAIDLHLGGGLAFDGLGADSSDTAGLGVSYAGLSDATGAPFDEDFELATEGFYRWQVSDEVVLQPDLQYIVHPGGRSEVDDALVFTLRVEVAL